jgi:acetyl esterase
MLDTQAQALLDLMRKRGVPAIEQQSPADARAAYRDRRFYTQPDPPAVAQVEDLQIEGLHGPIGLRWYRPAGSLATEQLPGLVYLHGGGWVIGDLDTHDTLCRELANRARCAVVAVDYRMGPEHRFPAAVDDAIVATRHVLRHAAHFGVDPRRIAVGGDSAGGNLSAVVCLALRDEPEPNSPGLAFQLLIYPATDMVYRTASHNENGQGYMLTTSTMEYFRGHYIDAAHYEDWRASPLLAASHANLPPALVLTAGYDPLRDEGLAYADKLSAAGVQTQYVCFARQIHGFILMGRAIDEANVAVRLCADVLRRQLHRD